MTFKNMIISIARLYLPASNSSIRLSMRYMSNALPVGTGKVSHAGDQLDFVKSVIEAKVNDWPSIKNEVLNIHGSINQKNYEGVLLKMMTNEKKFDAALSFADHLKNAGDLSLGSMNGVLYLYYKMGLEKQLSDKEKAFILEIFNHLYKKYKVLDITTGERLLHALCVIKEWKKAFKVLDDVQLSNKPSHSAYSTLIATLFQENKKKEALKLIERSINDQRPLQFTAYEGWINYILRKYKDKNKITKYLEEICTHISFNCVCISEGTAKKFIETYTAIGWNAQFTRIKKENGQCMICKGRLECLKLSEEEFYLLQKNIKDKLIVGSDLFLKTSPDELQRFMKFIEKTAPYDIVIDALNVAFAVGKLSNDRVRILTTVVQHFKKLNKKIFLLGRKHMLKWPNMKYLLSITTNFFIDNLSEDDPYFITAAILSGSNTDIVSKDLLRGHRFQLHDKQLSFLFQRWQWQHQWMVFMRNGHTVVQTPLSVTPCAQMKDSCWHIPFDREDASTLGLVRDGAPNWSSWLCLCPPR